MKRWMTLMLTGMLCAALFVGCGNRAEDRPEPAPAPNEGVTDDLQGAGGGMTGTPDGTAPNAQDQAGALPNAQAAPGQDGLDAAGQDLADAARGAGDVVRDAGDAVGNAVRGTADALTGKQDADGQKMTEKPADGK